MKLLVLDTRQALLARAGWIQSVCDVSLKSGVLSGLFQPWGSGRAGMRVQRSGKNTNRSSGLKNSVCGRSSRSRSLKNVTSRSQMEAHYRRA